MLFCNRPVTIFSLDLSLGQIKRFQLNIFFFSLHNVFVTNPAESERSLFQIQILDIILKGRKSKGKGTI